MSNNNSSYCEWCEVLIDNNTLVYVDKDRLYHSGCYKQYTLNEDLLDRLFDDGPEHI